MKTLAKMIYETVTYHNELPGPCNLRAEKVETNSCNSTYYFKDGSTLSINNFGLVKVDGHIVN